LVIVLLIPCDLFAQALDGASLVSGGQASSLSFEECYRKVAAHYPVLRRQNERIEMAIAEKYQSLAGLYPQIRGVSSVATSDDPVTVFGMLLKQHKFSEDDFSLSRLNTPRHRTNFNFALQGEMPLFNAFQTISRIRSSSLFVKAARFEREFLAMDSLLLATEAYLRILAAEEELSLIGQVKSSAEEDLRQAEDLKNRGMVLGADFYAAKVILSRIERIREGVGFEIRSARAVLNILMGEDPEKLYVLQGNLPGKVREAQPLGDWLSRAYQSRKDLEALSSRLKAMGIEKFREKTTILPRINAFTALEEDTHDWRTGGDNYIMGFKGTMDIFDPTYWGRWKRANHAENELKEQMAILKDEIARSLADSVPRYESHLENLSILEQAVSDAGQATEQTALLYREGRKSIADLLEMRAAYLENAMKRVEVLSSAEFEYEKLLFLAGALDESHVGKIAERLEAGQ